MTVKKGKNGWQYKFSYTDEFGKRHYPFKSGYTTKREAELAEANEKEKVSRGVDLKKAKVSFAEYMQEWYDTYRKGKFSNSTDVETRRAIKHAKELFGNTTLNQLTRSKYQKAINKYAENRAENSVRAAHKYWRMCLQNAYNDRLIDRNPSDNVQMCGRPEMHENLKFISKSELTELVKVLKSDLSYDSVVRYTLLTAAATGLRYGELSGLTWDNIDFESMQISVKQTWDVKERAFAKLKTPSSERTVDVDVNTLALLAELKREQTEFLMKSGLRNPNNLVFFNKQGKIAWNTNCNSVLETVCKNARIQRITVHGLRHTYASILLYEGINIKYISKKLGHKDPTVTLKTYSHIIDEMAPKESTAIKDVMSKINA